MNSLRKSNGSSNNIESPLDESSRHHLTRAVFYRVFLLTLLILGIAFLYPIEKLYLPIDIPSLTEVAPDDIIAPFDFPIYKNAVELERERQIVLANLKPVLSLDTAANVAMKSAILAFFGFVDSLNSTFLDVKKKISEIRGIIPDLPDSLAIELMGKRNIKAIKGLALALTDSALANGIVTDLPELPLPGSGLVIISEGQNHRAMVREKLLDEVSVDSFVTTLSHSFYRKDNRIAAAATTITLAFLRPNLYFDKARTEDGRVVELAAIPLTKGMVFSGEKIVSAGERIGEVHRDKLLSLAKARQQQQPGRTSWEYMLPPLGRLFFVAFPILFFFFFLYYFRGRVFASNSDLLLFALLYIGEVILLYIITSQGFLSKYLIPLSIATMLATILYDEEIGIALTTSFAMLVGVLANFKLDLAFTTMIAGTVACFTVRHVRHRHDFYRPMLYLCLTYAGTVYIIESLKLTPQPLLLKDVALAATNGFLSPILTIGLLPLFETAFGITTDITLLELSDLNRPLLKRLALEAPGTYHHSIMIGTLAEDAAESIKANSLLARVGSYYHDIGKMLKPEYFVENQLDADNKHERLTPTMSAIILEAHVKEGVELATRYGLPRSIIEFITGHHGTGIMTYFYDKARQSDETNADIDDFRYPGPNPRSKEVAIVMMADSVEAASRALDDPKPARIRSLVHRIFMDKMDSGLLENSELTLRDFKKIEDIEENEDQGSAVK